MASECEEHEDPKYRGKCTFKYIWKTWLIHIGLIFFVIFYTFVGAVAFVAIEGAYENRQNIERNYDKPTRHKLERRYDKEDIIEELRNFSNKNSDDWTMIARFLLTEFEREIWEMKKQDNDTDTEDIWTLKSAMFYSWTLITTIGYGNIYPVTRAGQAVTIAYSAIGIPLLLVVLANIGKAFTRMIKWVWKFFRRYYYTGSFKKPKKHPNEEEIDFKVDEDFNLPIMVAIAVWVVYILIGSVLFCQWEDWTYFESFYFCFISLSTIGLGDIIPENPVYMLLSSFYVVLGLTITSMVINVIQEFMSESYKMAAATIVGPSGLEDYAAGVGRVKVILKSDIIPPALHVDNEPPVTIKSEIVYFSSPSMEIPDIPEVFTKLFDEVEILKKLEEPEISSYPLKMKITNELSSVEELPITEIHYEEVSVIKPTNKKMVDLTESSDINREHIKQEMAEIFEESTNPLEEIEDIDEQEIEEIRQENYEIIESDEEIEDNDDIGLISNVKMSDSRTESKENSLTEKLLGSVETS